MVAGTLVQVGLRRLEAAAVTVALQEGKFPSSAKVICAPAHGLVLKRVIYASCNDPFRDESWNAEGAVDQSVVLRDSGPDDMVIN